MMHFVQMFVCFILYTIINGDYTLDHECQETSVCTIVYIYSGIYNFERENVYITRLEIVRFPDGILDIHNIPMLHDIYIGHQSNLPTPLCNVLRGVSKCVKIHVDSLAPVSCCKSQSKTVPSQTPMLMRTVPSQTPMPVTTKQRLEIILYGVA